MLAARRLVIFITQNPRNLCICRREKMCCFIAPNDDESGRSRNRRVEVVFTSSGVM